MKTSIAFLYANRRSFLPGGIFLITVLENLALFSGYLQDAARAVARKLFPLYFQLCCIRTVLIMSAGLRKGVLP